MAKQTNVIPDDEPLVSLKEDAIKSMENIIKELDHATKDLDALEELGLDTSVMRERIKWGYKAREVVLKRFGPDQ